MEPFPFRIGTTSYILPDDILPNVRFLGRQVDDVELVLFEVDEGPSNLPDDATLAQLGELARQHQLSYTVHLPLDLRLGAEGQPQHISLIKARRVIECTRRLEPWAYVLHLDGKEMQQNADAQALPRWRSQSLKALELVSAWAGGADRLAVENLEGYPPAFWEFLGDLPTQCCVDVGHLWLDGQDPRQFLEKVWPKIRVIHVHGIGSRDHQSLGLVPPAALQAVLRFLKENAYRGVLTVEVFNPADWASSLNALRLAWEEI